MVQKIERRFLVNSDEFKAFAHQAVKIVQGYFNSASERTFRLRIYAEQGF